MIIDCISDLHGYYPELEGGDLLIIAGDITASDKITQWAGFFLWLKRQKYRKKIMIGGNHDNTLQEMFPDPPEVRLGILDELEDFMDYEEDLEYLCDSGTEFENLKIWGTPWTKKFPGMNPHCMAFTLETDADIGVKFASIPDDTDILITHSAVLSVLDESKRKVRCGSAPLYAILKYRIRPKLHVFGHIHEGFGQQENFLGCLSVNASYVDVDYKPVNKPVRVIL